MRGATAGQPASGATHRLAAILVAAGVVASSFTLVLPGLPGGAPLGATHAAVIAASGGDPVIAAAGDIACDPADSKFNGGTGTSSGCRQLATSNLLVNAGLSAVLPLGDNQYYCGSYAAFMGSYDLSWGRAKGITYPTVGNHEYLTSGGSGPSTGCDASNTNAAGYYQYFGARAGNPSQGYYSFDIGAWHLISLNTQCSSVGGCSSSSPQGKWLAADLAAHPNQCTLAFFHIPLFSSGGRAASNSNGFWQLLYAAKADVILNGHDHIYERFAPQSPTGALDTVNGIREFIVGTGGANSTSLSTIAANSEVTNASTFGVLDLTLHATSYDWNFVPEAGKTFTDSGSGTCHATGGGGGDTQKPTIPTITSGTAVSSSRVDLAWTTSTDNVGVTGYTVYRNGSPIGTTTGPAATTYSDLTVSPSTTYNYTVDAFDAANNHSNQSSVKVVTTPAVVIDTGPPTVPSITSATAPSSGRVDLAWTTATDDIGVIGYTVYRNGSSIGTTSGPTATTYSDLTVSPSTSYSYTVDAFDAAGHHSNPSAPAVVTTPAASVTVTLVPIADSYVDASKPTTNYGTSISLRVDGSPVVQSYVMFDLSGVSGTITKATLRVFANTGSGAGYTVGGTASTWTENGLTAANAPPIGASVGGSGAFGTNSWTSVDVTPLLTTGKLSVALSGINSTAVKMASRESGTTSAPQLVLELASAPPPPVASFTASVTTQTAGLPISFTDTSTNTPTSWLWDFGDGTTSTLRNPSHTWTTAGPYTVSLTATNAVGPSVPAATAGITIEPDTSPPTAPSSFSATAAGSTTINLAWGASTDNVGVTGYELYRTDLAGPLALLGPATLTYQDTSLTPSTTYTYTVLARDAATNPSAIAGPQSATTDPPPPPPPSQLTLAPIADSYVDTSAPTTNYGTSTQLRFDGSPVVQTYIMFDLTGLSGTITRATLRVYANTASSAGYTVGGTATNWTETGLTAGNAPVVGASVGGSGAITAGTWTTVDVTALVASGKLSFALSGINSTAVRMSSRESGAATAPQLVLDFGP
ncbi:MAG: DNRLRE domain-containing protein [Chloroflexota bacterium]|nr:MAG: DNRLRE domain-containing protein [Chloroflexota bacterium]